MINLLLSTAINATHIQMIAQATTVYLPISTTQSSRANCVTYTATNATSRPVSDIYLNRRNKEGKVYKTSLLSVFGISVLESGQKVVFDMCDNSFVNVEARQ